jgi:hypothetical protein
MSANNKGGNEAKPRAMHKTPGICLTAEEKKKEKLNWRMSDEGCATSHTLKWVTYLQMIYLFPIFPLFPSFSFPEKLCDPTDLIWR